MEYYRQPGMYQNFIIISTFKLYQLRKHTTFSIILYFQSSNGVFVNGIRLQPLTPFPLTCGDLISIPSNATKYIWSYGALNGDQQLPYNSNKHRILRYRYTLIAACARVEFTAFYDTTKLKMINNLFLLQ